MKDFETIVSAVTVPPASQYSFTRMNDLERFQRRRDVHEDQGEALPSGASPPKTSIEYIKRRGQKR